MKIVGYVVVGTGEADRYLERTLDNLRELTDQIVVACNAKDQKTKDLVSRYPKTKAYNFSGYEWGKKQNIIKEELFRLAAKEQPDWIMCLDADERLDKTFTRGKAEMLANRNEVSYTFYCVQLWDREDQMRIDGAWGGFRNVRFFRFLPHASWQFERRPLHCGLAPLYAYRWSADSEHAFIHYGYMREKDRKRKTERYKKYDPNGVYRTQGYYDSITTKPTLKPFKEEDFVEKLKYSPKSPNIEKVIRRHKMEKTYYVKNKHGKVFPVREGLIEETLKRKGMELLDGGSLEDDIEESLNEVSPITEKQKEKVREELPKARKTKKK